MQIGSNVPNMIGTAALQFTAYLAQTSLEASIRRRKNKGNGQKNLFLVIFSRPTLDLGPLKFNLDMKMVGFEPLRTGEPPNRCRQYF